jgi:hypothetical protein
MSYTDNIKQPNDRRLESADPSIKVEWNHPEGYRGKYYLVLTTMFQDYIDIKTTYENFIDLSLLPYKKHTAIIYKVVSEECRESDLNIIVMK